LLGIEIAAYDARFPAGLLAF